MAISGDTSIDPQRRRVLGATGYALATSALVGSAAWSGLAHASHQAVVRWGFVGTGRIANMMAGVLGEAPSGILSAVSSRRMSTAQAFADKYDLADAFDSWLDMVESDVVDAIYIATPTSVKEVICLEAASNGKHVLVEKPFASTVSVRRMAKTCEDNDVAFMDATHFVHHPRTPAIREGFDTLTGTPHSLATALQFKLEDRTNIRYNRELEPMGAIGDVGWYNMRAAVEFLPGANKPARVHASLRRDPETGAAIGGGGHIVFEDRSLTTWNCGFDSGAFAGNLGITGSKGVIELDNFIFNQPDNAATYRHRAGDKDELVTVSSEYSGAALMFEDFAKLVADPSGRAASVRASELTQTLLDLSWESALESEGWREPATR